MASNRQRISDLKIGDKVRSTFAVSHINLAPYNTSSRAGEYYLRLVLMDASGSVEARLWDGAQEAYRQLSVDDYVYVEGQVVGFRGLQLNISSFRKQAPEEVDLAEFQPCSSVPADALLHDFLTCAKSVEDPHLAALLGAFANDDSFINLLLRAPGGRLVHHAYSGGLLEHTLEVVGIARTLSRLYPSIADPDLLLTCALLHDIGKVKEYNVFSPSFNLTDAGRLLGHIVLGHSMVLEKIERIAGFPPVLKIEVEHAILTHHGQREWGSPEVPKTATAFLVFHADLVSARCNQFSALISGHSSDSPWTQYDKYLERHIFIPSLVRGSENWGD